MLFNIQHSTPEPELEEKGSRLGSIHNSVTRRRQISAFSTDNEQAARESRKWEEIKVPTKKGLIFLSLCCELASLFALPPCLARGKYAQNV